MPLKSKKGRVGFYIGIALTVALVGWALFNYDFAQVWDALKQANYWWVLPAAIIEVLVIVVRAIRWRYFLEPIKEVSHYNSNMATFIGFTGNMILPARAGEFIRAWLIGRKEKISGSAAMGTVVIERVVDGLTMVVIMIITLSLVTVPSDKQNYWDAMQLTGFFFAAIFFGAFAMAILMYKRVHWVEKLIDWLIGLAPERFADKVKTLLESFRQGFDFMGNAKHIFAIIFWSAIFWGVAGGLNICFFKAFDLQLPFIATYMILIAQVVGVMAPSPGFVGPYHAATIAALSFYNIDPELALSMAIVMHATMFLTNTLPGVFFLLTEKMNLSDLQKAAKEEE